MINLKPINDKKFWKQFAKKIDKEMQEMEKALKKWRIRSGGLIK